MELLSALIIVAVVLHGLIAGISFDAAVVKLPARKRIGYVAYTQFARANDLGNGLIVYPLLGIVTVLSVVGIAVLAYLTGQPPSLMLPLGIAVLLSIAHSLCTALAAPIMLSLRHAPEDASVLKGKLDRFAFWNSFRAVFQSATFIVLVWALMVRL